jgi:hypothetical protein
LLGGIVAGEVIATRIPNRHDWRLHYQWLGYATVLDVEFGTAVFGVCVLCDGEFAAGVPWEPV